MNKAASTNRLSANDLYAAFRAVAGGTFSLEDAIIVGRDNLNDADRALSVVLRDVCQVQSPNREAGLRILKLVWEVVGRENCLRSEFLIIHPQLRNEFLRNELETNFNQFSESELKMLHAFDRDELSDVIEHARVQRVQKVAQLLSSDPPEINSDATQVKEWITKYGLPTELNICLDRVSSGLGSGNSFDQGDMLGALRKFLEGFHKHILTLLYDRIPKLADNTPPDQTGNAIDALERHEVIEDDIRKLGRSLHGLLSGRGAHSMQSAPEYVRLCRNMLVEYALIVLYGLNERLCR